jgi:hypothetical protein
MTLSYCLCPVPFVFRGLTSLESEICGKGTEVRGNIILNRQCDCITVTWSTSTEGVKLLSWSSKIKHDVSPLVIQTLLLLHTSSLHFNCNCEPGTPTKMCETAVCACIRTVAEIFLTLVQVTLLQKHVPVDTNELSVTILRLKTLKAPSVESGVSWHGSFHRRVCTLML